MSRLARNGPRLGRRERPRFGRRGERPPHVVLLEPYNAGLAIARRMTRAGGAVTVLEEPGHAFVSHSRGVHGIVRSYDPSEWLGTIGEIGEQASGPVVVIPATDRSSELLVGGRDSLPPNALTFEHRGSAHLAFLDKQQADAIARRAGVLVPWTARVNTPEEFAKASESAPWPCVVKPIVSHEWRALYGQERAFLVAGTDAAAELLARPLDDGVGMLLSQYVPGGDDDVEEAIVVRLADGSYPVRFGCRKLRQYPPGFGATALGESSRLEQTMALAERVLDEAGFVGAAGVEAKRHAETDERWFLEVNVRVPWQWGLGDACGAEATPRLVAALLGQPLGESREIRTGVRIAFPELDAHVVVPALKAAPPRRRPALAWRLLRPYLTARVFGMFALRDPGPGWAFCKASLARRWARLLGRGDGEG